MPCRLWKKRCVARATMPISALSGAAVVDYRVDEIYLPRWAAPRDCLDALSGRLQSVLTSQSGTAERRDSMKSIWSRLAASLGSRHVRQFSTKIVDPSRWQPVRSSNKIVESVDQAISDIPAGATLCVGGFGLCGSACDADFSPAGSIARAAQKIVYHVHMSVRSS